MNAAHIPYEHTFTADVAVAKTTDDNNLQM